MGEPFVKKERHLKEAKKIVKHKAHNLKSNEITPVRKTKLHIISTISGKCSLFLHMCKDQNPNM